MKQGYCDITMILDRSSSMSVLQDEAISGYNAFVDEQRKLPGEASMTLILFNHAVEVVYTGEVSQVPAMTRESYRPSGMTALYDAVAFAIRRAGGRFDGMMESERPEKVIVAILTDGEENSSSAAHADVAEMIKHQQEKYAWEFIFLGANMDAPKVAMALNIPAANASNFDPTDVGVREATQTISDLTTSYRIGR